MKVRNITEKHLLWIRRYGLDDIPLPNIRCQTYTRGESICREGERLPNLLCIIQGKVRVSVTGANGKSLLYCINDGQGIMGSIELLIDAPATATGLTLTDVTCLSVPIRENIDRLRGSLTFMNALAVELSILFERSARMSATNILYPLETRLSSYIALTQENGTFTENLMDVHALLGASYRHLLRTLSGLCRDGVLAKAGRGYRVVDQARLLALAEGYYDAMSTRPPLPRPAPPYGLGAANG